MLLGSYQARPAGHEQPPAESVSISCLCCRDSAIIPPEVVKEYLILDYNPDRFYPGRPDAPILCTRRLCKANRVWTRVPVKENGQDSFIDKEVYRYNPKFLDDRITPQDCDEIHRMELAKWQNFTVDEVREMVAEVQQAMADVPAIIKPMVALATEPQTEPEVTEEMQEGLEIGDWVTVCVDHMSEYNQKEIIKHKEAPVGEFGEILDFKISEVSVKLGDPQANAIVKLESGLIANLPPSYLRRVKQ